MAATKVAPTAAPLVVALVQKKVVNLDFLMVGWSVGESVLRWVVAKATQTVELSVTLMAAWWADCLVALLAFLLAGGWAQQLAESLAVGRDVSMVAVMGEPWADKLAGR